MLYALSMSKRATPPFDKLRAHVPLRARDRQAQGADATPPFDKLRVHVPLRACSDQRDNSFSPTSRTAAATAGATEASNTLGMM